MITASHHPWNKNGLKFFTNKGGLEGKEVAGLLTEAQALKAEDLPGNGSIRETPFLPVYMKQLADRIRKGLQTTAEKPLEGLQVAVDAGNGAGGFYADLMASLGASTKGSQFLDPDGYFPNHIPNPENPDAMKSIQKAVLESGADVGVIFDADCDRAAIVDGDGKAINRNCLIALISAILLEEEPGQTIVTDSVTSSGLADFIRKCGGKHYRFKRGYRNVIDEAIRLNGEGERCPLAIETSGHAALRENHFLDDGMYLVTVLIIRAMQMKQQGGRLGSIIAELKEPAESAEIRLNITETEFRAVGEKTIELVTERAKTDPDWHIAPDNREGIRISFDLNGQKDAGWFLLRLSVHDPVMPVNAESDISGGVQEILRKLYEAVKDSRGIDLSPLKQAAGV
jgi:phosphomannomutase